jgi:hypothetical protein
MTWQAENGKPSFTLLNVEVIIFWDTLEVERDFNCVSLISEVEKVVEAERVVWHLIGEMQSKHREVCGIFSA